MGTAEWTAYDEGYLRAYQWSAALAGGSPLPQETVTVALGPGEVAHAHLSPVAVVGYFGENKQYRNSFLLFGGPVGLALTGAASVLHNKSKKAEAERAAVPRWHQLGSADVIVTNQRLLVSVQGQVESFWYAEAGPIQMASGTGGVPAVQLQPAGMPLLRLESSWAPMLYVFAHFIVDGRAPGVPMPAGVLERAQAQGRV